MSRSGTLSDRPQQRLETRRFLAPAAILLAAGLWWTWLQPRGEDPETAAYIAGFSPAHYEIAGTDFLNSRYDPRRLGKPLHRIDITYDYDFERLEQVASRLQRIDRRKALKAIFNAVTADALTEAERHAALLRFVHKASFHSRWMQPMQRNGQAVFDPLVVLELGEMRCGQVARLLADLYEAAGYKARLVQVAAHVSAEVFYDGDWRLIEGDMSGGGVTVWVDGKVPSVAQLSLRPFLIDKLPSTHESSIHLEPDTGRLRSHKYPSYFFFSKQAYAGVKPSYYYKDAAPAQMENSIYHGWDVWRTEADHERRLSDFAPRYEPGAPRFRRVDIEAGEVRIAWDPSDDKDGDLLGYRVYLSQRSRGWDYPTFSGDESVREFWNGGDWEPGMYDALFRLPPSDVAKFITQDTSITIPLRAAERLFVTVVPFDMHGESVKRRLYRASEELVFGG